MKSSDNVVDVGQFYIDKYTGTVMLVLNIRSYLNVPRADVLWLSYNETEVARVVYVSEILTFYELLL